MKWPYWDRSFHVSNPDNNTPLAHFNADFGPLARFNHQPLPKWLPKLGSTSALRRIGGALGVLGLVLDAYNVATAGPCHFAGALGGAVGGWVGAGIGTGIGGTLLPGLGAPIGGFVGGALGGLAGQAIGDYIDEQRNR